MSYCWILCTPRTGSSFLSELLNHSGAFPPFGHPQAKDRVGPIQRGTAFGEWARLYDNPEQFSALPPPHSKMICHQYVEAVGAIPKPKKYNIGWYHDPHDPADVERLLSAFDSRWACGLLPGLSFVHLRREPVSHAVSLYFARETKKYHIYDRENLGRYLRRRVRLDPAKLMDAYRDAVSYQSSWTPFLKGGERILDVDYDGLVGDPGGVLRRVLDFLGVGGDADGAVAKLFGGGRKIYRMTRPEAGRATDIIRRGAGIP